MRILMVLCVLLLGACNEEAKDDVVKQASKDGSVETTLSVQHLTGYDLLTTTHKVWVHNNLVKTMSTVDTLASLGTTMAESDEDDDGNTQKVTVPKNYELYITVK